MYSTRWRGWINLYWCTMHSVIPQTPNLVSPIQDLRYRLHCVQNMQTFAKKERNSLLIMLNLSKFPPMPSMRVSATHDSQPLIALHACTIIHQRWRSMTRIAIHLYKHYDFMTCGSGDMIFFSNKLRITIIWHLIWRHSKKNVFFILTKLIRQLNDGMDHFPKLMPFNENPERS